MTTVLEMRNISKYFPGVIANENINFILQKGEIHTILGENGAGKSTLMNILSGLYRPDSGNLILHGQNINITSPHDAARKGIGMVHQHFRLSEKHTAFDNIIIGYNKLTFFPDKKKLNKKINDICNKFGLSIDLHHKIYELSIGDQQKVEIIKTLINDPQIMIFDEPTAVLSSSETETLFCVLQSLKQSGYSIIFISHKLDEVLKISDRITILSRGHVVDSIKNHEVTKEVLAEKMIGRKIFFKIQKDSLFHKENIIELKNATAYNNKGLIAIDSLDVEIKKGEIFGLAGVSGNGQVELAEILFGLRKMECEYYKYNNSIINKPSPKTMMKSGIRLIPSDRKLVGSAIGLSIPENFILNRFKHNYFSYRFFLKTRNIHTKSKESTEKFQIKHHNFKNPVRDLSGGNLQKVIVAREIDSNPEVLIAVYPTRGLDIGAIENFQRVFIDEQNKGKTIILISEEIEEIMSLSDRVGVMYKGKILKVWDKDKVSRNELSLALGGVV